MKSFMFKLLLFVLVCPIAIAATAIAAIYGDYFMSVCCGIATILIVYLIKIASDEDKANIKAGE